MWWKLIIGVLWCVHFNIVVLEFGESLDEMKWFKALYWFNSIGPVSISVIRCTQSHMHYTQCITYTDSESEFQTVTGIEQRLRLRIGALWKSESQSKLNQDWIETESRLDKDWIAIQWIETESVVRSVDHEFSTNRQLRGPISEQPSSC